MADEVILEFERVSKSFGDFAAVRDVSFQIRQGEFLTLLGPSGCGKTTMLRMIAGFEHPSAGDIRIAGKSMRGVMPYQRPLGMVFQSLALFPHMDVGQNVAFGLRVRKVVGSERERRVTAALELVGLKGFERRRVHELSGGQRQRVALARALIIEPAVLLLDEPLGALDLKLRRQLQIELKRIQQRIGTTFVFVTHDQEEALTMSDRIAVVNAGRIEQLAGAEDIYDRPVTAFVANFVGESNVVSGVLKRAAGGAGWQIEVPQHAAIGALNPGAMTEGARAMVIIRPERIAVSAGQLDADVKLNGVIVERLYAGSNLRLEVRSGDLRFVVVVSASVAGARQAVAGREVQIGWNVSDAVYLPEVAGGAVH